MALTIGELTRMPQLRTWIHAGPGGAGRIVTWAHVSELPEPWEWLSGGELVMTVGLGVPAEPGAQATYVRQLAEAGASGLAIAERLHAPSLSAAMVAAADCLDFPILYTGYEVPFIAIERAVADASRQESQALLARALRIYEAARLGAAEGIGGAELVRLLARAADCEAAVVDPARGRVLLKGQEPPAALVQELVRATAARPHPLPAVLRLSSAGESALAIPVPARRAATLLVTAPAGATPDTAALQHVATIAALELEKLAAERERERRLGAELLAHLLDRRIDPAAAAEGLERHGLAGELVVAACARAAGALEHRDLHHELAERGIANLLLQRTGTLLALLPATRAATGGFREELDPHALVGLSAPFSRLGQAGDALGEARFALEAARTARVPVSRYGDLALSPFLPRTLSEAREVVARALGPLLAYDAEHGSELTGSLRTFLEHNRSWQRAAAALQVHKQTLVYRMRRVEQLTGRRLDRTGDVAELWLALRALDATEGDLPAVRPAVNA